VTRYKKRYSASNSIDFVIPLLALLLIGIMYLFTARSQNSIGFILAGGVALLAIYWVRELRKMTRPEEQRARKEADQRDWFYDLIRNDGEMIFVAEVPGPEDQINVRLSSGMLRIKGGQNFAKDVPLEANSETSIADYKYRNGVLTIRITQT
jgi:HSP20 family molecular chaperone IbpA